MPTWKAFVKSTLIILIIGLVVNTLYYILFGMAVKIPIPAPYGLKTVLIQTVIAVLLNGFIHYKQRITRNKNTFGFVYTLLVPAVINILFCAFMWDIRMMPSINEMNRLYGEPQVPDVLFGLSAPLAIIPCLLGMLGIPALVYSKRSAEESRLVQSYRSKALQLLKVHFIISMVLIVVNILFYNIYINLGENMPAGGFTYDVMVQMTLVTTGIAVLLYLYITDNGRKALSIYYILTVCITIAGFLAGLPHPNGQPVYDDSLWLNVPLAVFSFLAETFGIPFVFRKLEKMRLAEQAGNSSLR
jgi:hypothetical protein